MKPLSQKTMQSSHLGGPCAGGLDDWLEASAAAAAATAE